VTWAFTCSALLQPPGGTKHRLWMRRCCPWSVMTQQLHQIRRFSDLNVNHSNAIKKWLYPFGNFVNRKTDTETFTCTIKGNSRKLNWKDWYQMYTFKPHTHHTGTTDNASIGVYLCSVSFHTTHCTGWHWLCLFKCQSSLFLQLFVPCGYNSVWTWLLSLYIYIF